MDEMQQWELYDIYQSLDYADASAWEQTRLLAYLLAQVNSKKKLSITDILKFAWDGDQGERKKTTISNEEIKRLKERAAIIGRAITQDTNGQ